MRIFAPILRLPLPRVLKTEVPVEPIQIGIFAGVTMVLGYALLLVPRETLALLEVSWWNRGGTADPVRLAGALLGCFGVTLLCLAPMAAPEVRRRIATGLHLATLPVVLSVGFGTLAGAAGVALFLAATSLARRTKVGSRRGESRRLQQSWQDSIREAAAQQERNRLARDLHDSIKQQIFSVRVASATVEARWDSDPEGAREALAHVRRSAQEAAVEMQALLHQLRPEALANVGLVEALREQGEALGYRTGARVVVEVGELPPDEQLPPDAQEALFRIAQEALANVARHARAAHVHVHLGRAGGPEDPPVLELAVRDDGQGFDPAQEESGIGLRSMRERLQPFNGHLQIDSQPAAGTRLTASLPLLPAADEPAPEPAAEPESRKIETLKASGITLTIFTAGGVMMNREISAGDLLFLTGFFWLSFRSRLLRMKTDPEVAIRALVRVHFFSAMLWASCLGWKTGLAPWLALPLAGWGLVVIGNEARRFYRLPRWVQSASGRVSLTLFLLNLVLGLPLLLLLGPPQLIGWAGIAVTHLLYAIWWTWDSLEEASTSPPLPS